MITRESGTHFHLPHFLFVEEDLCSLYSSLDIRFPNLKVLLDLTSFQFDSGFLFTREICISSRNLTERDIGEAYAIDVNGLAEDFGTSLVVNIDFRR